MKIFPETVQYILLIKNFKLHMVSLLRNVLNITEMKNKKKKKKNKIMTCLYTCSISVYTKYKKERKI